MNKVIGWMQTSLDGRTHGPNGEFDWPNVQDELHGHFVDTLRGAGMFCYGRRVYEMMAGYWPTDGDLYLFGGAEIVSAFLRHARTRQA